MLEKLYNNEVKIWNIAFNEQAYLKFEPYFYILSPSEKYRSDSFKLEWCRKIYVLTYVILRLILSTYTGIKPELIKLYSNKYGKPFIESNKLSFNISHSKEQIAIALSAFEVGIDIEYVDPEFNFHEITDMVLSDNEKLAIKALNPSLQNRQFFLYWTQKEALLKAIGTGINLDLNTLEIISGNKIYKFKEWKITSFKISNSNYVGHIAYKHNNKRIKYYDAYAPAHVRIAGC